MLQMSMLTLALAAVSTLTTDLLAIAAFLPKFSQQLDPNAQQIPLH
jgi:hypothetical protein